MGARGPSETTIDTTGPRDEPGPGLMVCGTTSNAGKTTLVAGLCRILARRGLRVAPFKAQNMALNSAVTRSGHEIGRAQYLQAEAAGVVPEVAMNPILLKPTSERGSQVVVGGRPRQHMTPAQYHEAKPELLRLVLSELADLRSRFDAVVVEGAGSPAEINLLEDDIVNLRIASEAGIPAVIVGDIDQGGVFAALHGTVDLLPPPLRATVVGFVVNKFRGDPALLGDGFARLRERTGLPTFGVVPLLDHWHLDAEDSLALETTGRPDPDAGLDVAVIALPHIANFTDLDPLLAEPDVAVRHVRSARALGRPDLVILPGSKATVDDLGWLRETGLDRALSVADCVILGICGGYQMLGRRIHDGVESGRGEVAGLGLLPVDTEFAPDKVLAQVGGMALGVGIEGYQIHHGRVSAVGDGGGAEPWLELTDGETAIDGWRSGPVFGTTVHGLFGSDDLRRAFLNLVAAARGTSFRPSTTSFAVHRESAIDRLADAIEHHVDLDALLTHAGLA